jgi:hypothetical protein
MVVRSGDHVAAIGRDCHSSDRASIALERTYKRRRLGLDWVLTAEATGSPCVLKLPLVTHQYRESNFQEVTDALSWQLPRITQNVCRMP